VVGLGGLGGRGDPPPGPPTTFTDVATE
jgi:hypothetical protein